MDKPYVIGIDIGGTNTVFGVVDTRGNVLYNGAIKTGQYEDVNDYVRALGEGRQNQGYWRGGAEWELFQRLHRVCG